MAHGYPASVRLCALTLAPLATALCALALGGCGNTLQDQPIPHNTLEGLIVAPYPVYWLGDVFQHMQISEATHDPSGAFSVQYGDCVQGGQSTCIPPLRIVTSPDNSFVSGGSTPRRRTSIRGVMAVVAQGGATIEIPTAGVVLGIYARDPRLAAEAAATAVPINEASAPQARLPAALPDTGFAETPLPVQKPSPLRALR
jgi:hypothetical protein